jgi:Family of unknown function (DUF6338)
MLESIGAVSATVLALVPGALYVWGFERVVGNWGVRLSDRLLRFVGVSVVFHALFAPLTYWIWANYVVRGDVAAGRPLPLALWLAVLGYVAIPTAAGAWIGIATRSEKEWAELFTGPDPAPRAWDHLFSMNPQGWMRLRLKSGTWIGGAFATTEDGRTSYAAGYPEPQDLYLARAAEVDPDTGEFRFVGDAPVVRDSGLLVRWSEVEYLEFIEDGSV